MTDLVPLDAFSKLPERYQRRAREIANRVGDIDALLSVATAEQLGDELKRMRRHLRPQPDTEPREMAEGFKASCRDLPAWAISEAASDFLGGRVENHTGQFMPTCAEFAKRAREILTPFLAERSALRVEASRLVERAADDARRHAIALEKADPAVRRRVAEVVAAVFPAGGGRAALPPYEGLSPERQARIDALKKQPPAFASKIPETRLGRANRQQEG